MADRNVLSIAFDDSTTTNYESQSLFVQKLAPKNVNINAGVPSGDVVFEFSTPKDTFCDLFKTYMSMEYAISAGANNTLYVHKQTLLPCMFQRAVCHINGVKVSVSNNYTMDGMLSRRLQFGKTYNQSVNGVYDIPSIAANQAGDSLAGNYIATDTLDSFWLRQAEGLIVPPNSNVRFEFTIDSDYLAKNVMKTTGIAAVFGGLTVANFWLHPCMYVNPSEVKSNYRLRFISMNSFMSTINNGETSKIFQYTISPTIMKACLVHLPVGYKTVADGAAKWDTAYLFNSTIAVSTLQFKVGNVVYPQTPYSFTYGHEDAYQDYINHSQQIAKDSGKEEYAMYRNLKVAPDRNNWGRIFVAPIVKDRSDPTNTLEVNHTFADPGANVFAVLTSLEEQAIDISMEGMEIKTTPTV